MIGILISSVTLAMFDYKDRKSRSPYNKTLELIGHTLSIIFILEAIFKIIAMGFMKHKGAYLRDPWNVIDFIIAISG